MQAVPTSQVTVTCKTAPCMVTGEEACDGGPHMAPRAHPPSRSVHPKIMCLVLSLYQASVVCVIMKCNLSSLLVLIGHFILKQEVVKVVLRSPLSQSTRLPSGYTSCNCSARANPGIRAGECVREALSDCTTYALTEPPPQSKYMKTAAPQKSLLLSLAFTPRPSR